MLWSTLTNHIIDIGWVYQAHKCTEGGCQWRLCMLTSEITDAMLICIVRWYACRPLTYDSSFIHPFIQKSLLKLYDQKNRIEFLPTYPTLKVSSRPISVEGRGHGWSFPESYTDHKVSVTRLVTPLVSRKKKHFT